ncbi:MAG: DNA polymerase III subunit gamma/tau [Slackia sp.]|nr:DNA polymerase III subunit gamma/tau [Slackia sp.]
MSESLYRKYRPQTFDDVVGQTHIERTLKNAIESDKVSHAYLFCGPRGTGKTTTARLLSKALLCECGPTPSPDGTCEQCRAIAQGTHPDVNELDAASRTGVDNVREEIISRVHYAPTLGRYKVYIIDEVHMLSTAAFNALLKTLEEPPDHVVFILCTTDPQRVPDTILSRCQRFDFHSISNEEIVSRLSAVCTSEGVEFDPDALSLIALRAQGGMRDALTSLEQLIAFGEGRVTLEVAQSVLGSVDADDMGAVVRALCDRDAAACFAWVARYVETGADLARFARDLASYVRDLYVLAATGGAVAVSAPESARPAMAEQASAFGVDRLAYALRVLGDTITELRTAANPRLCFEIALTRMVRPESELTLESLAARVAALESAVASGVSCVSTPGGAGRPEGASGEMTAAPRSFAPAAEAVSIAQDPAGVSSAAAAPARPSAPVRPEAPAAADGSGRSASFTPPAAVSQAVAAMDKAQAFREQLARRRAASPQGVRASAPAPASDARPLRAPQSARDEPRAAMSDAHEAPEASEDVRAKIADESLLQRGWQAALADLKQRRAAYGALMLSARIAAAPDAAGVVIEFARENTFAFAAARKPDIAAAIADALHAAFGGAVPFEITQATDASSSASVPVSAAVVASAAVARSARAAEPAVKRGEDDAFARRSVRPPQAPCVCDDDVVPYSDADAVPYSDADAASYAPWDDSFAEPVSQPPAVSAPAVQAEVVAADAPAPDGSKGSEMRPASPASDEADLAVSSDGAPAPCVLTVDGPDPVDPYEVGKRLGFDSMPDPRKKTKGLLKPVGWPGFIDGGAPTPSPASAGASASDESPRTKPAPPARDVAASASPDLEAEALRAAPSQDNPFASRRTPASSDASFDRHSAKTDPPAQDAMSAADIFASFGVAPDRVREER